MLLVNSPEAENILFLLSTCFVFILKEVFKFLLFSFFKLLMKTEVFPPELLFSI